MSKRKNNRLGKAGITFYTYATERIWEKRLAGNITLPIYIGRPVIGSAPFWVGETFFSRR